MKKRKLAKRISLGLVVFSILFIGLAHLYIRYRIVDMPGTSYVEIPQGQSETIMKVSARLKADVVYLADKIGGRSIYNIEGLDVARNWIIARFSGLGMEPKVQNYEVEPTEITQAIANRNETLRNYGRTNLMPDNPHSEPQEVANIWVQIAGRESPEQLLVIGAHYDTVAPGCPGADDNSSGVAGLLEIAAYLSKNEPKMSVCLVAFTCEEYPIGGIDKMGSSVFLKDLVTRRSSPPIGMISLEMLGYYSTDPGSQHYPAPFSFYFSDTADFIGFVGDSTSRKFIRSIVEQFRNIPATIPSEGVAAPVWLAPDVLRSDHEPFTKNGIPGLMVTDTSNFRYGDHLHQATDTPDRLDFTRMAYVVDGLGQLLQTFEYTP